MAAQPIARLLSAAASTALELTGRGAQRAFTCFLLGGGLLVSSPRCSACGRAFAPPRTSGERFRVARELLDSPRAGERLWTWMLTGRRVLVARAAPELAPLLNSSATMVGEKVLVSLAPAAGAPWLLLTFCRNCGENLVARLHGESQDRYGWDWLVDFRPRNLFGAIRTRKLRARIGTPRLTLIPARRQSGSAPRIAAGGPR
jgi:hypothetical protein